ncbi:MAG: hypothetical protein FJ123_00210 [Deltaproteobacteria bacterium]|nr:hypothetical protein [Deltaproteobacteria bacterium]
MREKKIGRNEPCPCGSGKKFKRCHGSLSPPNKVDPTQLWERSRQMLAKHQAKEIQRKKQQGWGNPIISADFRAHKFVAVGNRLYFSKKWKTFHDFLGNYIASVFGKEWGEAELRKPLEGRHPVCVWYHHTCQLQQQEIKEPGKVHSVRGTGAAFAWLHLGYDLYCLAHNAELQTKLVARLKNRDGFRGARYEVFVAAALIRAGFKVEFENEDDRKSTHCEFTATCQASGRKYSVEAKQRNPTDQIGRANSKFRLGHRLHKALRKAAKHPRVIFIDINVPDTATEAEMPIFLQKALTQIRLFEGREMFGQPIPSAYLFVTNLPFEHNLESTLFRTFILAEGFQIPDFKMDTAFPSIRAAYEARKSHSDMHQLLKSLREHSEIPSTFEGEAPELAFGDNPHRLIIGERYLVPDGHGNEIPGKLNTATVDVTRRVVYGAYLLENGQTVIATNPLTESELAAYKRFPDTFFGVPLKVPQKTETALELFDFIHESYRQTPRETLLRLLEEAPDIDQLRKQTQEELAVIYAERCTYAILEQKKH